jgi:hypothetical protein
MNAEGSLNWYIPDAYLPEPIKADGPYFGHESVCVLNVTNQDAELTFDFYFEDREPIKNVKTIVPAERTRHIRLDLPEQIGGIKIPVCVPYAIRIRSTTPIIVQYSRLDTTQIQATLMTTMAYPV